MTVYDLLIIGGGPAGLAAGIYGARAKLKTVILEKAVAGGQAYTTRELVNYPGFKETTGPDLTRKMAEHAEEFGTEIIKDEVIDVSLSEEVKVVITKKGEKYHAKTVILALGSQPRMLGISGEKEFRGMGVSYCATCDAEFYEDLPVVVVGNGDAAIEEAMYITKFASKVTVIVIHDEGILDCNKLSAEKAFKNEKIEFIWNSVLDEIKGSDEVESVIVKNLKTGKRSEIETAGVFIYVGMVPGTGFLQGVLQMDDKGYIITNENMETSLEGVYAAGDSRVKPLRQVVTAVSDGAIAAVSAEHYIMEEDFKENILGQEKPVLLAFWSPADSKSINFISRIEELVAKIEDKIKLVKIDLSRKKGIAKKFAIRETPSLLLLKNGKVAQDFSAILEIEKLQKELEKIS